MFLLKVQVSLIRKAINGCYTLTFFQIEECLAMKAIIFPLFKNILSQNTGILRYCVWLEVLGSSQIFRNKKVKI